MRAGQLRYKVTVQTKYTARDAYGAPSVTWKDNFNTWASISPLRGAEYVAAQETKADVTHHVRLREAALVTLYNGTDAITNGTFEGTFTSGLAASWTKWGGSQTYAQESTILHGGSKAQRITCVSNIQPIGVLQSCALVNGKTYKVIAWVYSSSARAFDILITGTGSHTTSSTVPSQTWTEVSLVFTPTKTESFSCIFYNSAANSSPGQYIILDDISIKERNAVAGKVTPNCRVKWGSRYFDIEHIIDKDKRGIQLDALCKEVV